MAIATIRKKRGFPTAIRDSYAYPGRPIFVFVFSSNVQDQTEGLRTEPLNHYINFLDQEIADKKIPGYVSMVSHKGKIVHAHKNGYSNIDSKAPIEMDQLFYIQSMTKPIISTAFMMLYEEGHFMLTDPLSKYIPEAANLQVLTPVVDDQMETTYELRPLNKPIKIHHLLSHTAGFSHGLGSNEYDKKLMDLLYMQPYENIGERVQAMMGYPLMGQPGEQWNYSASPDVLSVLIEQFSGITTEAFLQERIFGPLGMNNTGYNLDDSKKHLLMEVHQIIEDGTITTSEKQTPINGEKIFSGTHGLRSTAKDYMTFATFILKQGVHNGKRLIGRKTIELMTQDHVGDLYKDAGYGFGLGWGVRTDVSEAEKLGSLGTHFWSGAFNTYFFIDPTEELIAVLMTHTWPYTNYYSDKMRQFIYSALLD